MHSDDGELIAHARGGQSCPSSKLFFIFFDSGASVLQTTKQVVRESSAKAPRKLRESSAKAPRKLRESSANAAQKGKAPSQKGGAPFPDVAFFYLCAELQEAWDALSRSCGCVLRSAAKAPRKQT